jgi:hypothetical protein
LPHPALFQELLPVWERRKAEWLFETSQAFSVLGHRSDIFLADDLLRRGRTDHFREPAQMGWTPGGLTRIADVMPQPKCFEPELGGLEIPDGVFTRPAQIADGFVFDLGNIDGSEVPERMSRASCTASRPSVLTRSPALFGIKDGATTQHS